jgi:hypothetical protein
LLYYPVRFCGSCGGTGWKVRWVRDVCGVEIKVAGPYSEIAWTDVSDAVRAGTEEP